MADDLAAAPELIRRKRALRAEIRRRRNARDESERLADADAIAVQARALIGRLGARSLACYLSSESEPGTRPLVNWAVGAGLRVLLPVTREDGLLDWVVADGSSERRHELGFPEAVGEALGPIAVGGVDVIFVPAAAVDRTGARLGWGRGYYDRTLGSMAARPPVHAIVGDDEVLDELPRERHDEPVDGAITPTRALVFDAR